MPKYCIFLEKKVSKQLEKFDKNTRDRIVEALHVLRDEGFSRRLDIVKLRGYRNHYRLRVGKLRILFELERERTIIVHAVLPRETAY